MSYSDPLNIYIESEFGDIKLKDKRLTNRLKRIGMSLIKSPGSCIQEVMASKTEARATYDFMSNVKVKWKGIFDHHREATLKKIATLSGDILLIHDTMVMNYTTHKAKIDFGLVGHGHKNLYGTLQHTCLAIHSDLGPLGLLSLGYYDTDAYDTQTAPQKRPINERMSYRWVEAVSDCAPLGQSFDKNVSNRFIHIADREGDFIEFFNSIPETHGFIVRCLHRKRTIKKGDDALNVVTLVNQLPPLFDHTVRICDKQTHEFIHKTFKVSALAGIDIITPGKKELSPETAPVKATIVYAVAQGIEWIIYTNLPVTTHEEIKRVLSYYAARWHIENFHKVLKTAYKIEDIYVHATKEAILNLMTIINILAIRTYWLVQKGREKESTHLATTFFSQTEIESMQVYFKQPPHPHLSLYDATILVARLGGLKNLKNPSPPGILTLYRGLKVLNNITTLMENIVSTKT